VALAMYQILETNPKITLDTTMQSVLNLTVPPGAAQPDAKFAKVTIRHLLESNSGINRSGLWMDVEAANAFGGTNKLPVTPTQLAQYIASLPMDKNHEPGDKHNVVYNNTGYFLLSLVVAKLRGANSFEEAITSTLLKPLGISRIRQSPSLVSAQASDEARYQLRYLNVKNDKGEVQTYQRAFGTWPSVRTPDRPLVPSQYGSWSSENHDGAGGLSAAAVDLARIVAMFSSGTANPVLKPATLNQLFDNAVTCTTTYTGPDPDPTKNEAHGYHGLDWANVIDKTKNLYRAAKGGYLPASQNGFSFDTGDLGLVICIGSNEAQGVKLNWETAVRPLANQQNWGTTDLFTLPEFGSMKSLVPATGIPFPVVSFPQPKFTILDAMKVQQTAVTRLIARPSIRPVTRPVVEREPSPTR
jgi:CubicO group peptidase (beta-lactamase class C family)